MNWSPEIFATIIQTVVLVIALIAAIRHSERRMATMETEVQNLKDAVKPIPGISRAVARLEGKVSQ